MKCLAVSLSGVVENKHNVQKGESHSVLAYWKLTVIFQCNQTNGIVDRGCCKVHDTFTVCIVEIFPAADAVVETMDGPSGVEVSEIKPGCLPFLIFYCCCVVEGGVDVCSSLLVSFF
ncbi:hypothetical protein C0J52_12716 [Blattella germanica]|nr:hypothetical protein C0J52_12716 [Blattella germanica]